MSEASPRLTLAFESPIKSNNPDPIKVLDVGQWTTEAPTSDNLLISRGFK